ncbi:hypothetical protein DYB37_005842 [Aphanomyces astaci]|uniref:Uncharacterized protein n=1 Tax=Aphanomyces astaci TaxID=112090 RepID=A0A397ESK1_APHAT|nr:hypothetical protein DYB25_010674 [Aphanomyces astaci]RHY44578.1 hypothetical protein DYB30_012890 [Aphanomyces astaci]RHY53607.1 hypothetical protein DYB34_003422 [Aphanomyces astaci]RHY77390.1 hypothetical protein DYB38_003627 [Aphanomyces astaci]RHY82007.1 hypothetical protein DYB35_004778 [Aphanomyces astaci]
MLHVASTRSAVARPIAARTFTSEAAGISKDPDVVIPELSETLEWTLTSPPPIHQFEESPIIVETWGSTDPYHH